MRQNQYDNNIYKLDKTNLGNIINIIYKNTLL